MHNPEVMDPPYIVRTERLTLRHLDFDDAPFIIELLNQPSFLRYIGDKKVRNVADAHRYLQTGPLASYEKYGYGLYWVGDRETGMPVGICGLIKRDSLEDADIGFAFLPEHCGKGYAPESGRAVLEHGKQAFGLERVVAIVQPDNQASIRVLGKLGFRYEKMISLDEKPVTLQYFSVAL